MKENYRKTLSEKSIDLANFLIAAVILGQIGFGRQNIAFSIIIFVTAFILYIVSYLLSP